MQEMVLGIEDIIEELSEVYSEVEFTQEDNLYYYVKCIDDLFKINKFEYTVYSKTSGNNEWEYQYHLFMYVDFHDINGHLLNIGDKVKDSTFKDEKTLIISSIVPNNWGNIGVKEEGYDGVMIRECKNLIKVS
jgi:hypothetical protein